MITVISAIGHKETQSHRGTPPIHCRLGCINPKFHPCPSPALTHLPCRCSPCGWLCSWCPQTSRTWASGAPRCRSRSAHCVYPHAGARAAGCAASAPAAPLPPWPWQSQRRHRHVSRCCPPPKCASGRVCVDVTVLPDHHHHHQ